MTINSVIASISRTCWRCDTQSMSARLITVEEIAYRVFLNREQGKYRAFWFCPHADCYGAFRCEHVSETPQDALEIAANAAHDHEGEKHRGKDGLLSIEYNYEVAGLAI